MAHDKKEREKFDRQREATEQHYFEAKREHEAAEKRSQAEKEEFEQYCKDLSCPS